MNFKHLETSFKDTFYVKSDLMQSLIIYHINCNIKIVTQNKSTCISVLMLHQGLPLTLIFEDGCTGVTVGQGTLGTQGTYAMYKTCPSQLMHLFPSKMLEGILSLHQPYHDQQMLLTHM